MDSDERSNAAPEPIVVAEHEGEYVRVMRGKLPAINLEMEEGYVRNTHLKMELEVRIRNVHYDEITSGKDKGDLVRQHNFALESASIVGAMTPEQAEQGVGGGQLVDHIYEDGPARECFYNGEKLEVIHRGQCELCADRIQTPVRIEDPSLAAGF